jgi:aquaporin Z
MCSNVHGEGGPVTSETAGSIPWQLLVAEMVGTAVLLLIGLSLVIVMFGSGSPVVALVPSIGARRAITGTLFGSVGAAIALSPLGKESGAHVNPVVTLGFLLMGKLDLRMAIGYVVAQLVGAIAGVLPLLAWGDMGRSVAFGATLPGAGYPIGTVLMGEIVTTFALVAGLCVFIGFRPLRPFTPALIPPLYAVMSYLEAAVSGTSTNPARTLGPALLSGRWDGFWIYCVGPLVGMLLAIVACSRLARRISVAKLYHFDSDPHRVFHRVDRTHPTSQ